MKCTKAQRGSTLLEFTLACIPLLFAWLGIVQLGIGMWRYHTLQYAVKATGAYVAVHGSDCAASPNNCAIEIENAAQVLQGIAFGISPTSVNVTFTAVAADHLTPVSSVSCRLDSCLSNTTAWPPSGNNSPGQEFEIKAVYQFQSALAMVAPGSGGGPVQFGTFYFPGYTHQTILF
jgi:Flp pilus assembly protein TadG